MVRYNKSERATWPEGFRRCVVCKNLKPFLCFHKHAACWRGVNTVCTLCRKPASQKHWAGRLPEARLYNAVKSRATARNIPFSLDPEDIQIPAQCPVFHKDFVPGDHKWAASVDRIDPTKGYVKGNIMVVSNLANMMKNSATPEELRAFGKWACEVSF